MVPYLIGTALLTVPACALFIWGLRRVRNDHDAMRVFLIATIPALAFLLLLGYVNLSNANQNSVRITGTCMEANLSIPYGGGGRRSSNKSDNCFLIQFKSNRGDDLNLKCPVDLFYRSPMIPDHEYTIEYSPGTLLITSIKPASLFRHIFN